MKKYLNISFLYAVAAMAGGVFYREFTKFNGYTGTTALGKVHTHLFLLGMLMFLVIALYAAANASISGIAGIGHILTGAGIILLLLSLKTLAKNGD